MVVAHWTEGSTNHVITSAPPRPLAAGHTVHLSVPFALSTFANGTFPVIGQVTGAGFDVSVRGTASTNPWGLHVLGLVAMVGLLLALAALIGRHTSNAKTSPPSEPPPLAIGGWSLDEDPTEQLIQTGAPQ
jgi:hypothetical protein